MSVLAEIAAEVNRATSKFPTYPTDALHAYAILGEECGELNKAVLQLTYEPHKTSIEEVREEAIQTAAMAVRFLQSLDAGKLEFAESKPHKQPVFEFPKLQTSEGNLGVDLDASITTLNLLGRDLDALHRDGVHTIRQIVTASESELLCLPHMTRARLSQIKEHLLTKGICCELYTQQGASKPR